MTYYVLLIHALIIRVQLIIYELHPIKICVTFICLIKDKLHNLLLLQIFGPNCTFLTLQVIFKVAHYHSFTIIVGKYKLHGAIKWLSLQYKQNITFLILNDNDNEVYSYPGLQACEMYKY